MGSEDQFLRRRLQNRLLPVLTQFRRSLLLECLAIGLILLFSLQLTGSAAGLPDQPVSVSFYVVDENQHALALALVEILIQDHVVATGSTDLAGKITLALPAPGQYQLRVTKKEYFASQASLQVVFNNAEPIEVVLSSINLSEQEITVHGTSADPIAAPSTYPATLTPEQAKQVATRPSTLREALPLVPGVVRANDGSLGIAGYGENHSSMLVNSVDVTDPSTGDFGLSVPIDTVETINVSEMPYLVQYGKLIDQPRQTFFFHRPHPALGKRIQVRTACRQLQGLDLAGLDHLAKHRTELAVAIL